MTTEDFKAVEKAIQAHEANLKCFVDVATGTPLESVERNLKHNKERLCKGDSFPGNEGKAAFGSDFANFVKPALSLEERFGGALPHYISMLRHEVAKQNIISRFVPVTKRYEKWYFDNLAQIWVRGIWLPYHTMHIVFQNTHHEIKRYFELEPKIIPTEVPSETFYKLAIEAAEIIHVRAKHKLKFEDEDAQRVRSWLHENSPPNRWDKRQLLQTIRGILQFDDHFALLNYRISATGKPALPYEVEQNAERYEACIAHALMLIESIEADLATLDTTTGPTSTPKPDTQPNPPGTQQEGLSGNYFLAAIGESLDETQIEALLALMRSHCTKNLETAALILTLIEMKFLDTSIISNKAKLFRAISPYLQGMNSRSKFSDWIGKLSKSASADEQAEILRMKSLVFAKIGEPGKKRE